MARLPDLVRDSQLEAVFCNGYMVHIFFESNPSSRQRAVPREEVWKPEKQVGSGGFGRVWPETCMDGPQKGALRAVKKHAVRGQGLKDITHVRELEAVAKFSQRKVPLLLRIWLLLDSANISTTVCALFCPILGWYKSPGSLCMLLVSADKFAIRIWDAATPTTSKALGYLKHDLVL
jgi:hypothetical protein